MSRMLLASMVGVLAVLVQDGLGRILSQGIATPGLGGVLCALGAALGAGLFLGAALGIILAAAGSSGPARELTAGALLFAVRSPLRGLAAALALLGMIAALAIPARASLLGRPGLAALVDLAAVLVGWTLFIGLSRRFGRSQGLRVRARPAGWSMLSLAVIMGTATAWLRPDLEPSGLWDLVLLGTATLATAGAGLVLPPQPLRRSIGIASLAATVGGVALWNFDASASLREDVGSDWRPASWVLQGMSSAVDVDGDGYSPLFGGGDCDDSREDVNPEAPEIAGNGVDENCRGGDRPPRPPWPARPGFVELPEGIREPRSILMISIDTLRHDHMGMYGYDRPTTPRLDVFSRQGVRFDLAYSAAPTTRIAVPSLHTGRSIGEIAWDRRVFPYRMLDRNQTLAEILRDRGFSTAAFVTHRYLGRQWGFAQGFQEIDESLVLDESVYRSSATGIPLARKAAEWLGRHSSDRFFAWVHLMDPHKGYVHHQDGPDFGSRPIDLYDGEIEYSDRAVGILLDKLDEIGIARSTTVVILSDHGEYFGEHGRSTHGGSVWEEGSRIPLLIRSPGLRPGVSRCITAHTDVAPTLLNLLGVDGSRVGMSGATLLPDMTGARCPTDREIVTEMRYGPRSAPNLRALVGQRFKLTMDDKLGTFQLYDLQNDRGEQHDVSRRYPRVLAGMKHRLLAWTEVFANRELIDIVEQVVHDEPPPHAQRVGAAFANGLELVAVDFGARRVSRDQPLDATVYLRASRRVRDACEIVLNLVSSSGRVLVKERHPPINGTFPVRRWPLGKVVGDGFAIEIRRRSLRGRAEIRVGLDCAGQPVEGRSGEFDREHRVRLGNIRIGRSQAGDAQTGSSRGVLDD